MQLCADIEDELDDPSYVSCTPSGSEEEEVVSAPKVADKKRKEQDNPNPRKVKLPKLDPVRSPSPEFEHQQKKKEKTGVQKGKKRLHHRREENLICKKEIHDILCHLWKHAEKVDIGANEVMHISSVAKRKGWRWSTSRVGTDIMWFSFARPINPCRSRRLHRPPQNQKQKLSFRTVKLIVRNLMKSLLIKTTLPSPTPLPNITSSSQHFTST